jgi:urease accessory protein
VETGIALSVLLLGTVIVFPKKIPLHWAMVCVALFGFVHGFAHGQEIPGIAKPALYALGFLISTALLHLTGVLVGHYAQKARLSNIILQYGGITMSVVGLFLLFGI